VIELVEDLSQPSGLALLKWDRSRIITSPRIVHGGKTYVPLPLGPSVRRALRLPSGCALGGPTTQLLAVFETLTDLAEQARRSLAAFVFASWIPDLVPVPVTLFVWAPDPVAGARVLTLLSSLCRLALALSGADAHDLTALPDYLPATLLLFLPSTSRRTRESLAALGWRGFRTCRRGRLVETVAAKAIASNTPLLDDTALRPAFVVHVPATRRSMPPVNEETLEALAKELLPLLLRYRLQRCDAVVGKSTPTRPAGQAVSLVSALEVCFSDAPALKEVVSPLIEAAQNGHETGRTDPRMPLLEAVLARCHEKGRDRLYVAEMALDLNAQILANGGKDELTDRMVGSLLRSLGLATRKLDRRGRGLLLDGAITQRIHHLAHEYDLRSAGESFPGCVECAQAQPSETQGFANE
jgi:hypothetical protein